MKPFIIGVAGGSGSGKSTVTEQIVKAVGHENVTVFIQDNFYLDRSNLTMEERNRINFDHPDALDWDLMAKLFEDLTNGLPVEMPQYDFSTHTRKPEAKTTTPAQIIVLEGIFGLYNEEMTKKMALRIFVDTAGDIRLMRRLKRDISERAHVILPNGSNKAALEMIVSRVNSALNNQSIQIEHDLFIDED